MSFSSMLWGLGSGMGIRKSRAFMARAQAKTGTLPRGETRPSEHLGQEEAVSPGPVEMRIGSSSGLLADKLSLPLSSLASIVGGCQPLCRAKMRSLTCLAVFGPVET